MKAVNLPPDTVEPRTTTRGAIVWVGGALVVLFILIGLLNGAYHRTRLNRAEDRYRAGVQLAEQGKNERAADDFRAALVYEHDDPKYRLALAKALVSLGRWDEAESHLQELREREPTNGPINQMLATVAVRGGRYDEAIDDYNRAIYGYWPDNPEQNRIAARFELMQVLERRGMQKQMLAELLALAGEVPDSDVATRLKIGSMLLANHSPQHAAETYHSILATHPREAAAEQGLGEADFELGNYTDARNAFRAAERHGAADPELARKLQLSEAILNLDPTLVRLSAAQRRLRSDELLRRTLTAAEACTTPPPDLSAAANRILSSKRKRGTEDDMAATLTLSQQLWSLRQVACPQRFEADPALAAVMAEIAKQ